MNFYDTITEMGYQIVSKDDEVISICKEDESHIGDTYIDFYIKDKEIYGYVKPKIDFYITKEISYLYHTLFINMRKDLKYFSDKSNYKIGNEGN